MDLHLSRYNDVLTVIHTLFTLTLHNASKVAKKPKKEYNILSCKYIFTC